MKFRLKRVDATDPAIWSRLVQMDSSAFLNTAPPLTDNEGAWWIAYAGQEEAAYCAIKQSVRSADGAYLSRAGVMSRFRGNGLQKQMIRVRLAYAKQQGWKWVVTDTNDNPASSNSLIACGFRMFTPTSPWSVDGACYWRKTITAKQVNIVAP